MLRFIAIAGFIGVVAGCNSSRLSEERLASLVQMDSGLDDVKVEFSRETQSPRWTEYTGSARDSEGIDYDLGVDVDKDSVFWRATPRPRLIRKDLAEQVAIRLLELSEVTLVEDKPGAFDGSGIDVYGERHRLRGSSGEDLLNRHVFVIKICDDDGFMIRSECFYENLPCKGGDFGIPR